MEKKILSLSAEGKLVVKSADGREQAVYPSPAIFQRGRAVVYLLIDTSSSMYGEKIEQAKAGALDFAKSAVLKGYLVGVVGFNDAASLICEPTRDVSSIADKIKKLLVMGSTNLTDALRVASEKLLKKPGYRAAVVATDGCPNDPNSALEVAEEMKRDKIEILAISTEDANRDFLSKLVSRKDLNLKVEGNEFRKGMDTIAKKLPVQFLEHKR